MADPLRLLLEHTPAGIALLDRELRYLAWSRRWVTDFRLEGQDLAGRSHYEVFPEIPDRWRAVHRRCLAGAVERCDEEAFPRADGTVEWIRWEIHPWRGPDGAIGGIVIFSEQITEQKRAEQTLRESEERFRDLVENLNEAVFTIDAQGVVSYISPAIARVSHYAPEDIVGRSFADFVHPDDLARMVEGFQESMRGVEYPAEYRVVDRDGSVIWVRSFSRAVRDGARIVGLRGVLSNITAIKESEEAYRALVDHALQGLAIIQDGRIAFANQALDVITGAPLGELTGQPLLEWIRAFAHPDDQPGILAGLASWQPGRGEVRRREFRIVRRDGAERWALTLTSELTFRGRPATQVLFADITERRQAEDALRQLNAELEARVRERTAQFEATARELEAFSYSVSHDLRSPLRAIDGFALAVLEDAREQLPAACVDYLGRVRAAAQRMGALTDQLLFLSRVMRAELRRGPVDLGALAHEVAAELERSAAARQVQLVVAPDMVADGDPVLLRAVLANLLGNAWKFTRPTAAPRVEVGRLARVPPVYFVRDNGVGFDMAHADQLFRAFHRLHATEEFDGSGIGLATVQRIVQRHGGRIWAEGAPDRGATFFFTLGG